jgi:type I restriction enzyme, S subunit
MNSPTAARWTEFNLSEVLLALRDGTHGSFERVANGIPFLSAKNIREDGTVTIVPTDDQISERDFRSIYSTFSLTAGDVLLTIVESLGRRAMYRGERAAFQRSVAYLRPDPRRLESRFLYHLVGAHTFQRELVARSNATAQAGVYLGELARIKVQLPSTSEQRRIAEVLDTLDDQIRVTERMRAKWLSIRTGMVHDLMSGDWAVRRLGDLTQHVTSGSRGWARYYADEGARFIRIGNLTRAHINLRFDSMVRVAVPAGVEGSRTGLQPGDLLISITADLGIIGVAPDDLGEAYINQHIALVRVDPRDANPRWLGHFLSSPRGQSQFQRLNDQGAKAGLNLPTVANLEVSLPTAVEQARRAAAIDDVDKRIRELGAELMKWKTLRSGVMEDLLTGRVRTPVGATL